MPNRTNPRTKQPLIEIAPAADAGGPRAQRIVYPENPRYRRIRSLSTLMDNSIVLPSGYRIGLDPLLGLLPGIGDAIGALISSYLVYEAARLGVQKRVLLRMAGNICAEVLAGAFPVLGDIFDATWKANMRNLRLLDLHYRPSVPERSARQMTLWIVVFGAFLLLLTGTTFFLMAQLVLGLAGLLFPAWF
jgi:hypothetical protein